LRPGAPGRARRGAEAAHALFAVVLLISGFHGMAVRRGQDRLARLLAVATLLGSVGVLLLATALVPA
jgi:hypothetical protein